MNKTTFIGFKIIDGSEEQLINEGWKTLIDSKVNVLFCYSPYKFSEKIMLARDGSVHKLTEEEYIKKIDEIINLEWYSTEIINVDLSQYNKEIGQLEELLKYVKVYKDPYEFGTVAYRIDNYSFITTTRGKRGSGFCLVNDVHHRTRKIRATEKATLNAPLIEMLFYEFEEKFLLHSHKQLENVEIYPYVFDGTKQYFNIIDHIRRYKIKTFNIENHGYYKLFSSFDEAKKWIE